MLLLLLLPLAALAQVSSEADAYLTSRKFSGSVLLAKDGAVLLRKGYGMANYEHEVPNTPETKFRLASVSKQFTAAAILLLEQRGRLKVEDSVCRHVATCPAAWERITIHHLLTHTSGIPSYTGFADYPQTKLRPATVEDVIGSFRDKPLEFEPGAKGVYDNSGYFLLGHIIERVSGKSYEAFLRENIFQPLGMVNSGYDHNATVMKHRAAGYKPGLANADHVDMSIPYSAGALYSTVDDLYIWDQALYTDRLLPKSSRDKMFHAWATIGMGKNHVAYGYGFGRMTAFGRSFVGHGGGIEGFATRIDRYLDDRATVIVLSNVESSPMPDITRDLAAILFGETRPAPPAVR